MTEEQRAERVHHHMYDTCEGIAEHAERIVALEELVRDYHAFADAMCAERDCDGCSQRDEGACERGVLTARACALGVEVAIHDRD